MIGPSGAGKTTLLRCIAGLQPHTGTISLDKQPLDPIPVSQRQIGFVDQHLNLFPHLSAWQNIAYPLRVRQRPATEINERVFQLLKQFQIEHLARRLPPEMSGGEQQRVALARALIYEPRLLLLDEPFGALDALLRYDLLHWFKRWHEQQPITTLFVTHDLREARFISQRALVLINGRAAAFGPWSEIKNNPDSAVQALLKKTL